MLNDNVYGNKFRIEGFVKKKSHSVRSVFSAPVEFRRAINKVLVKCNTWLRDGGNISSTGNYGE